MPTRLAICKRCCKAGATRRLLAYEGNDGLVHAHLGFHVGQSQCISAVGLGTVWCHLCKL